MKVWVLESGFYEDERCMVGVFSSIDIIKERHPGTWVREDRRGNGSTKLGLQRRWVREDMAGNFDGYLSAIEEDLDSPRWDPDGP